MFVCNIRLLIMRNNYVQIIMILNRKTNKKFINNYLNEFKQFYDVIHYDYTHTKIASVFVIYNSVIWT